MYNEESIQMLKKSGADFEKHASQGIDPQEFGSLLITSGMTLSEDVNWISFHSGYDFAYLVKMLSSKPLPEDEDSYRKLVEVFFPRLLDVKYLWRHANNLVRRGIIGASATNILNNLGTKSGLQDLADELGCQRIRRVNSRRDERADVGTDGCWTASKCYSTSCCTRCTRAAEPY